MNILITGAAGFIGSYLSRALITKGYDVIGIDNFHEYYHRKAKEFNLDLTRLWANQKVDKTKLDEISPVFDKFQQYYKWDKKTSKGKFEFKEIDIRDYDALRKLFRYYKIDKVVHLAAMAGVGLSIDKPRLYTEVNIDGSVNLLDLSKNHNVQSFVFASSSSVYGARNTVPFKENENVDKPMSPYASTKRMMEIMNYTFHQIYDLSIINARIFGPIYGPLQRPFRMIAQRFLNYTYHNKPMPIFGDGKEGGRDTTYIDDEIDGLIKALESNIEFDTINIGTGNVVTPIEVANLVKDILKKGTIKVGPRPKSEIPITYADTTKAKKLLDFEAKWNFEDGLRRQAEIYLMMPKWYKNLPA